MEALLTKRLNYCLYLLLLLYVTSPDEQDGSNELQFWVFHEGVTISNCIKDPVTIECFRFSSLESAKLACAEKDECNGVSEVIENELGFFELRKGPDVVSAEFNSWVMYRRNCDGWDKENTLNVSEVESLYPDLRGQRRLNNERNCVYTGMFSHLNKLFKFDPDRQPEALISPLPCEDETIIFGIKSLPRSSQMRQALRDTWLQPEIWNWLHYRIKVVFLIAQAEEEVDLSDEILEKGDILLLDFQESLYNLPFKDIAFLRFIEKSCKNVDYVFKGDDDILLKRVENEKEFRERSRRVTMSASYSSISQSKKVPQNFAREIAAIRSSQRSVEGIGCLKKGALPIRDTSSKYFMPEQMYDADEFSSYFSGAAYVTTRNLALAMENAIERTQVLPMDDVYVGDLIQNAGKQEKLKRSAGICSGLNPQGIVVDNPCLLRGLSVAHKYTDPELMREMFRLAVSDAECSEKEIAHLENNLSFFLAKESGDAVQSWTIDAGKRKSRKKSEVKEIELKQMSTEEEEIKALFELFDNDGDRTINLSELETVMKTIGCHPPSKEEIKKLMLDFDEDGNEVIDFEEFQKMMLVHKENHPENPASQLNQAVQYFDKNNLGALPMSKLKNIMTELGEEPLFDDEFKCFAEFLQAANSKTAEEEVDLKHFKEFLLLSGQ
ncbi:Oidioi.mRNA.OKI2018_I69.chr1.g599.t1.cds [Oikopleura dioica]|uniref:Oidioi.mRNA.OKI2018_I69.chr1.g599.t1.cds n=1 Tax=Oikopleura dioica TaxID=34765 RepID=A0ABN7SPK6_OIKDI|nr:Oidioi.mRNA.OKI2018_I69.chr1.g599.t1.cds [Oikopleura dioica]